MKNCRYCNRPVGDISFVMLLVHREEANEYVVDDLEGFVCADCSEGGKQIQISGLKLRF